MGGREEKVELERGWIGGREEKRIELERGLNGWEGKEED